MNLFSIRLLPDKLANSKKFKKKYPIEIRPNGLKPGNEAIIPPNDCPEVIIILYYIKGMVL